MRRQLVVLAVAVLAILSLSLFVPSLRSPAAATFEQAAAKCDDPAFLKEIATDFKGLKDVADMVKNNDDPSLVKALLTFAGLRQKYEDLDTVPEKCYATQLYVIGAFGNYGDLVALQLAGKLDKDNAKTISELTDTQTKRIQKYIDYILEEIKGVDTTK